jgi:hypothetical protein
MQQNQQQQQPKRLPSSRHNRIIGTSVVLFAGAIIVALIVLLIEGLAVAISVLVSIVLIGITIGCIVGPAQELWTLPIRSDYHRFKAVRRSELFTPEEQKPPPSVM